jgi:hypothetical protein
MAPGDAVVTNDLDPLELSSRAGSPLQQRLAHALEEEKAEALQLQKVIDQAHQRLLSHTTAEIKEAQAAVVHAVHVGNLIAMLD